jgi:hypothetical protein
VAGSLHPEDAAERRGYVPALVDAAVKLETAAARVLAPHADHVHSGPVAASAFRALEPLRGRVRRVVVVGPSHLVPSLAPAASSRYDRPSRSRWLR